MNTLKVDAMKAIEQLPDEANIDDIMYRLYVIEKVRKGKKSRGKVGIHLARRFEAIDANKRDVNFPLKSMVFHFYNKFGS